MSGGWVGFGVYMYILGRSVWFGLFPPGPGLCFQVMIPSVNDMEIWKSANNVVDFYYEVGGYLPPNSLPNYLGTYLLVDTCLRACRRYGVLT